MKNVEAPPFPRSLSREAVTKSQENPLIDLHTFHNLAHFTGDPADGVNEAKAIAQMLDSRITNYQAVVNKNA